MYNCLVNADLYLMSYVNIRNLALKIYFLLLFHPVFSQEDLSVKYAGTITTRDLETHVSILAADSLEGRETGEKGQKMAAAYIEDQFKSMGLEPVVHTSSGKSYLQSFDLHKISQGNAWIKVEDKIYHNYEEFLYAGRKKFNDPVRSRLIFIGRGEEKDFQAFQVRGKNILIYCDEGRASRDEKVKLARRYGALNVFILASESKEKFNNLMNRSKRYIRVGKLMLPQERQEEEESDHFLISQALGEEIFNSNSKSMLNAVDKSARGRYSSLLKLKSKEIIFFANNQPEKVGTENVLAFIEGTDKRNEYIVITAHYDHIGMSGTEVNNGADDDASGTAAVMEIAQAFAQAKKEGNGPRRSLLFMTVTGEEKGLLGSSYYVRNPVFPLKKTLVNLNIDMIGRVDPKHEEKPEYVYVIGSDKLSKELHYINEKVNATYTALDLDYSYNEDGDPNRFYYRSDHYNFAKHHIPVIFYFNGTHADYHKPTDTVDKIEFDLLKRRAKLIFHTAWELANREKRIVVDSIPGPEKHDNTN